MSLTSWVQRRLVMGVVLVGVAALPLAAGLTRAGASVPGASFPLFSAVTGAQIGQVEVATSGDGVQITISLREAPAGTTYTVAACRLSLDGITTLCSSDPSQNTITTDVSGSAEAVLSFSGLSVDDIALVTATNTANAADTAVAALAPGAPPLLLDSAP